MHVHWHRQFNYTRCVEFRAVTSVLRLGGGGGELALHDQKGEAEVVPHFGHTIFH